VFMVILCIIINGLHVLLCLDEKSQYFNFVLSKVFYDRLVILIHTLIEFFF
jgi:hypothetical protein